MVQKMPETVPSNDRKLPRTIITTGKKYLLRFLPIALVIILITIVAQRLHVVNSSSGLRKNGFWSFQAANSSSLAIVVVSDPNYSTKYKTQARSIECYAELHGYEFYLLAPAAVAPVCNLQYRSFFFRKHCTVAQWLRTRPVGSVTVVLDGDVVAGTANRSLDTWLRYDFDVALYERSWNFEVMSGNYIVRNTKFARRFLHHWASYEFIKPLGFSSDDNGAIHLALLEALAIRGRHFCKDLYRKLEAPVTDLVPYFEFVACTKALLGPPRTFIARYTPYLDLFDNNKATGTNQEKEEWQVAGRIVIFPRLFGFAVDALVHGYTGFRNLHPFHHGVKSEEWKDQYLDDGKRRGDGSCKTLSVNGTISKGEMGARLKLSDAVMMGCTDMEYAVVPRWGHVDESCYQRLWCGPLKAVPQKWPQGVMAKQGKLEEYQFLDVGVDWYNEFTASIHDLEKELD